MGRQRKPSKSMAHAGSAAPWTMSKNAPPKSNGLKAVEQALAAYIVVVLIPFGFVAGSYYLTPLVSSAFAWTTFNIFPWNFVIFSLLFMAGSSWIFWAFSCKGYNKRALKLTIEGPYAFTRNPKGFGYLTILLGIGVLLQSAVAIFMMVPGLAVLFLLYVKILEDPVMKLKHGARYDEYRSMVPVLIPFPTRLRK